MTQETTPPQETEKPSVKQQKEVTDTKDVIKNKPIDSFIKIVLLSVLVISSYLIAKPFIMLIIWSIIVAVALYPFYQKITGKFSGKKRKIVATAFIVVLLALIIIPSLNIAGSIVSSTKDAFLKFDTGTLEIPSPNLSVKDWPLIGEKLHNTWFKASQDIQSFIKNYSDEVKKSVGWFFVSITGLMSAVLLSLIAIIIAGMFMASADSGYKISVDFFNKVMNGKGVAFVNMCTNTIRSVVKGIILVAVIQSILAFIGFASIGMSTAGLLAFVVLVAAIIQIPLILIVVPVIVYVFSIHETTPAIIFAIYIMIVALLDNVLKPVLLAKGLQTPMIIILIGAIGGMMASGILGLFIGPVVLAIAHRLYISWVDDTVTL